MQYLIVSLEITYKRGVNGVKMFIENCICGGTAEMKPYEDEYLIACSDCTAGCMSASMDIQALMNAWNEMQIKLQIQAEEIRVVEFLSYDEWHCLDSSENFSQKCIDNLLKAQKISIRYRNNNGNIIKLYKLL